MGGPHGNGRLLHHDFVPATDLSDPASANLDITQVGRMPGTYTVSLGRGIDADKDDVGFPYVRFHICGEKQVAPTSSLNGFQKLRLEHG